MEIIDLPQEVLPAVKVTWSMDANHGFVSSPFSGMGQVQRGQMERWKVGLEFRAANREQASAMQAFFLQLEGKVNVFRMYDPSAPAPLGSIYGEPTVKAAVKAGDKQVFLNGLPENLQYAFRAGDWIQIGKHFAKVKKDVHADASGLATLDVWPKFFAPVPSGEAVIYRKASGIFRFLSETPEWAATAGRFKPWSFKLTGVQEVITTRHELYYS